MNALVWHGTTDIRCDSVPDPRIEHERDAIIKVTNDSEGDHDPVPHLERFPCRGSYLHHLTHGLMAHHIRNRPAAS